MANDGVLEMCDVPIRKSSHSSEPNSNLLVGQQNMYS